MNIPILLEEAYWANSQFSIARYCGSIKINSDTYTLCNKDGITIFELSHPNSKHYVGDDKKAIEPGEPADLVRNDWIPIYKEVGREKFLEILKENLSLTEAKKRIEEMTL